MSESESEDSMETQSRRPADYITLNQDEDEEDEEDENNIKIEPTTLVTKEELENMIGCLNSVKVQMENITPYINEAMNILIHLHLILNINKK